LIKIQSHNSFSFSKHDKAGLLVVL
jgi:hypothetical protein